MSSVAQNYLHYDTQAIVEWYYFTSYAFCMGRLARLAAWHLPGGGPVGPPSRWAVTSNVEVGQRLTPLTGEE